MDVFNSIQINNLSITNRFVRSATNESVADRKGNVTEKLIDIYRVLAKGEIGLIISGFLYVSETGKSVPGQAAIFDDCFCEGLSLIPKEVHKSQSKIFAQIVHGGRQSHSKLNAGDLIDPSGVLDPASSLSARPMSDTDIQEVIQQFMDAAIRAKNVGFDGIQLHAAHGYLLSEFLSPITNLRTDKWGGSVENRVRIICEITRKIRERVGLDYPIIIKMNATDGFTNGQTLEDSCDMAMLLEKAGIDAIEISGGMKATPDVTAKSSIRSKADEAYFGELSKAVKAKVKIPIILVGGNRSLGVMNNLLLENVTDMIAISRPLICEPDLVKKFKLSITNNAACISCNKCFSFRGLKCVMH